MSEPLAARACEIRSGCRRSAYELRLRWRGEAHADWNRQLDSLSAKRRRWQYRFAAQYVVACGTDAQTAVFVFAVEFRVRNRCDLAADEQHAERHQCQR